LLISIKMAKRKSKEEKFVRELEIPEGTEIRVENNEVFMKKENKENKRRFSHVLVEKKDNKILVSAKRGTKREKKLVNSVISHLKNMLRGLEKNFTYKLQICAVHFPMNVSIKDNLIIVKNFLGESRERKAKILPNVQVKIEKDIIIVESCNKEAAGQTAANIEKMAKVGGKDRRIFQDGIFMIEKSNRGI